MLKVYFLYQKFPEWKVFGKFPWNLNREWSFIVLEGARGLEWSRSLVRNLTTASARVLHRVTRLRLVKWRCLVFIVNGEMLHGRYRLPAYSLCQTGCRSGPTVHLKVLQGAVVVTSNCKSKKVPIRALPAKGGHGPHSSQLAC